GASDFHILCAREELTLHGTVHDYVPAEGDEVAVDGAVDLDTLAEGHESVIDGFRCRHGQHAFGPTDLECMPDRRQYDGGERSGEYCRGPRARLQQRDCSPHDQRDENGNTDRFDN